MGLEARPHGHLDALQEAADRNGGNRAAGTPGYDASVRYVADQLRRAGYRPEVQRFDATTARNRSAPLLELPGTSAAPRADEDFRPFAFSGDGEVAAASRPVDLAAGTATSTSGCEPSDPGQPGVLAGTLGGPGITIPVLAVTPAMARQLAATRPTATVRFAWWGSEEQGLLGSRHYLEQLARAERDRIALYLNLDMVPPSPPPASRSGACTPAPARSKSRQQAEQFGGAAGQPADPCYHRRCDDLDNLDLTVLGQMADAAAHALATFARDPAAVDRPRG